MIRAIYRRGKIQPIDRLPPEWKEGQQLCVEPADAAPAAEQIEAWAADVEAAVAEIPEEEHEKFMQILAEVEAESKVLGRRELERLG